MTEQTESAPQAEADPVAAGLDFIAAERLVFFSDALVAIAITLLAFNLPVPPVTGTTNDALLHALNGKLPAYLVFLISFVVIGAHWRSHHRLFRDVARLDAYVTALDMVWLLMIIITPFATKLLIGRGGFGVRFGLYAVIQVVTLLAFWLMGRRLRDTRLLRPGASPPLSAGGELTALFAAAMFAISIPLGFIPAVSQWAYACWLAAGAVHRWRRLARHFLDR
jgi:uncharacterized membrane protein